MYAMREVDWTYRFFTCENIAHVEFYVQGSLPKILSLYTINAFTFQGTYLILNRDVKLSVLLLGHFISFRFATADVKDENCFPSRANHLELKKIL